MAFVKCFLHTEVLLNDALPNLPTIVIQCYLYILNRNVCNILVPNKDINLICNTQGIEKVLIFLFMAPAMH